MCYSKRMKIYCRYGTRKNGEGETEKERASVKVLKKELASNFEVFKKIHKAGQQMLKDRNLKGDKSIALHEILIDHQIDETDRELTYELAPGMKILNVKL